MANNGKPRARPHPGDEKRPARRNAWLQATAITSGVLLLLVAFLVVPYALWQLLAPESWTTRALSLCLVVGYVWLAMNGLSVVVREVRRSMERESSSHKELRQ